MALPFSIHIIGSYPESQRELVRWCHIYWPPQICQTCHLVEDGHSDVTITKVLHRVGDTVVMVEATDTSQEVCVRWLFAFFLAHSPAGVDDTAGVGSDVDPAVAVGRRPATRRVGRTHRHRRRPGDVSQLSPRCDDYYRQHKHLSHIHLHRGRPLLQTETNLDVAVSASSAVASATGLFRPTTIHGS